MTNAYLIKNNMKKEINATLILDIIRRYSIAGFTYNQHGQVIYLCSKNNKRIHSILLSRS